MRILSILFLGLLLVSSALAQPTWSYVGAITYPLADTGKVRPHLMTVDGSGNIWVMSSKAVDTAAYNALYKAGPADTVFTKVIDLTNDPMLAPLPGINAGTLRGIAAMGNDIYVVIREAGTVADFHSDIIIYRNGDPAQREVYGWSQGTSGYGTFVYGLTLTRDTILIAGLTTGAPATGGPTIRQYNFSRWFTAAAFGAYLPPAYPAFNPTEGGGREAEGRDVIRDVAAIPGADYTKSETILFSARNGSPAQPNTGGISIWYGGSQTTGFPKTKVVEDLFSELALGTGIPYGITADKEGNLYVAGVDESRRWVKAYTIDTSGAVFPYTELPSQTDPFNPNPAGAPFNAPCDVALSPDENTAYVIDEYNDSVYVFSTGSVGVKDETLIPTETALGQNYPNPFNPLTIVDYRLSIGGSVRLSVVDLLGREVAVLVNEVKAPGVHSVQWNAAGFPSGIYFARLTAGQATFTNKMILSK